MIEAHRLNHPCWQVGTRRHSNNRRGFYEHTDTIDQLNRIHGRQLKQRVAIKNMKVSGITRSKLSLLYAGRASRAESRGIAQARGCYRAIQLSGASQFTMVRDYKNPARIVSTRECNNTLHSWPVVA